MTKTQEAIEVLLDLLTELRNFEAADEDDNEATNAAVRATQEAAQKLASLGFVL